ncbi:MAG: hypothetical protein KF729_27270 [Sandaracinaceae bacterium]|nr:hypothetical protein [Sandaracinaceae bacterium]
MDTSDEKQFGRRGAILGIGVAAAGAVGLAIPRASDAQARPAGRPSTSTPMGPPDALAAHALRAPGEDVRALFGALGPGAEIGSHWRLEALYAVRAGAIPVVLSTRSGERFGVEIFRASEGAPALATAGGLALYLVNRGDGARASGQAAGLGVEALARVLEGRLTAGAPVPSALTTLDERARAHPTGVFHIPLA